VVTGDWVRPCARPPPARQINANPVKHKGLIFGGIDLKDGSILWKKTIPYAGAVPFTPPPPGLSTLLSPVRRTVQGLRPYPRPPLQHPRDLPPGPDNPFLTAQTKVRANYGYPAGCHPGTRLPRIGRPVQTSPQGL